MNKKDDLSIYLLFSFIYLGIAFFSFMDDSKWLIDNIVAISFSTIIFLVKDKIKLGKPELLLFNCALLSHNLGSFGLYGWSFSIIAYDDLTHFIGSFAAAYIILNWFTKITPARNNHKNNPMMHNKFILLFIIISCVTFLGVIVEFIEYGGFTLFEPGDGLFLAGLGDSGSGDDPIGQYDDTMEDMFVNVLGTVVGFLLYLHKDCFTSFYTYCTL